MSTFPFTLADLRKNFTELAPESFVVHNDAAFWMQGKANAKRLVVLANAGNPVFGKFQGESSIFKNFTIKLCPLNHGNARSLRSRLDWLKPKPIGLVTSAGMGDRLGLATPGHVRAMKAVGANIVPIFAQQSIREMQRTNRTPDDVMTDATFGAFEAGWRTALGADADHLKTPADIDACVAADYSFFTIDPGAHVDSEADTASLNHITNKVVALPWKDLESSVEDLGKRYVGKEVQLEDRAITLDADAVARAAAKY
ncbi:MAG: tagaturonate epimerase family protein, partial [Anaerolineales bacterium]|nr:tagaturonate epimerase family protein [Anaerolineales bacterium]